MACHVSDRRPRAKAACGAGTRTPVRCTGAHSRVRALRAPRARAPPWAAARARCGRCCFCAILWGSGGPFAPWYPRLQRTAPRCDCGPAASGARSTLRPASCARAPRLTTPHASGMARCHRRSCRIATADAGAGAGAAAACHHPGCARLRQGDAGAARRFCACRSVQSTQVAPRFPRACPSQPAAAR